MNAVRQHSNLTYRLEMLVIRLRDLFRPPARVLTEAGVRTGTTILDFGCGPGGFALAAAKIAGATGRVYALDINPMAIALVRQRAARRGFDRVIPITRPDELSTGSVDLVLLYDVLHIYPQPDAIAAKLAAIHRMLKPSGSLSIRDHHLKMADLVPLVCAGNLFRFAWHGRWSSLFERIATGKEAR